MSRTLGLLITAYEEHRKPGKIEEALQIALDPRIDEVVIADDSSSDYQQLLERMDKFEKAHPQIKDKVRRFTRNTENRGVFGNKLTAIRLSQSEWVQSLDSDNVLDTAYLDRLWAEDWLPDTVMCPSFAAPNFDYRAMGGRDLTLRTLEEFAGWHGFGCLINTGNQCFHRPTMLEVTKACREVREDLRQPDYFNVGIRRDVKWRKVYDSADSFYFNMLWLLSGRCLRVVDGLTYQHAVHKHSSWQAAPPEKDALPDHYLLELRSAAKHC